MRLAIEVNFGKLSIYEILSTDETAIELKFGIRKIVQVRAMVNLQIWSISSAFSLNWFSAYTVVCTL